MSARTIRQTAHFSITGEFITTHARDLWRERSFAKAFDVLECVIGSTREHHEAVIEGRAQFTGTNTLTYEPDAWIPPAGYPTFKQALTQGSHFPELENRREDEARQILQQAAKLTGHFATDEDKAEARMLSDIAARLIGTAAANTMLTEICADMVSERSMFNITPAHNAHRKSEASLDAFMAGAAERTRQTLQRLAMKSEGFDPDALATTDAILYRGSNLVPTLCPDMSSANGWLLPDGKFYGCGTMEHVGLAENLLEIELEKKQISNAENLAEDKGWIKLAKSFTGFHCIGQKKATKRQLSKLWDYAQFHGRDYQTLIDLVKDPV